MRKVLVLVLLVAACGNPKVEFTDLDGKNAENTAFKIKIDRNAKCPRGIYAQELYEALYKRDPLDASLIRLDRGQLREMELTSHEIEVQAAVQFCKADENEKRLTEVQALKNGYRDLFRNWSEADLEKQMKSKKRVALDWLRKHEKDIRNLKGVSNE